jgi:hypothetical protein
MFNSQLQNTINRKHTPDFSPSHHIIPSEISSNEINAYGERSDNKTEN